MVGYDERGPTGPRSSMPSSRAASTPDLPPSLTMLAKAAKRHGDRQRAAEAGLPGERDDALSDLIANPDASAFAHAPRGGEKDMWLPSSYTQEAQKASPLRACPAVGREGSGGSHGEEHGREGTKQGASMLPGHGQGGQYGDGSLMGEAAQRGLPGGGVAAPIVAGGYEALEEVPLSHQAAPLHDAPSFSSSFFSTPSKAPAPSAPASVSKMLLKSQQRFVHGQPEAQPDDALSMLFSAEGTHRSDEPSQEHEPASKFEKTLRRAPTLKSDWGTQAPMFQKVPAAPEPEESLVPDGIEHEEEQEREAVSAVSYVPETEGGFGEGGGGGAGKAVEEVPPSEEEMREWLSTLRRQPLTTRARELSAQSKARQDYALQLMEPEELGVMMQEIHRIARDRGTDRGTVKRGLVVEPDISDVVYLQELGYPRDQAWTIALVDTHMRLGRTRKQAEKEALRTVYPQPKPLAPASMTPPSAALQQGSGWGEIPTTSASELYNMSSFARLRRKADDEDLKVLRGESKLREAPRRDYSEGPRNLLDFEAFGERDTRGAWAGVWNVESLPSQDVVLGPEGQFLHQPAPSLLASHAPPSSQAAAPPKDTTTAFLLRNPNIPSRRTLTVEESPRELAKVDPREVHAHAWNNLVNQTAQTARSSDGSPRNPSTHRSDAVPLSPTGGRGSEEGPLSPTGGARRVSILKKSASNLDEQQVESVQFKSMFNEKSSKGRTHVLATDKVAKGGVNDSEVVSPRTQQVLIEAGLLAGSQESQSDKNKSDRDSNSVLPSDRSVRLAPDVKQGMRSLESAPSIERASSAGQSARERRLQRSARGRSGSFGRAGSLGWSSSARSGGSSGGSVRMKKGTGKVKMSSFDEDSDDEDVGDEVEDVDPVVKMFDEMDEDGSGELDIDEFVEGCLRLGLNFPIVDLERMFIENDADGSETMDVEEFEDVIKQMRYMRQQRITSNTWNEGADLITKATDQDWQQQMEWLEKKLKRAARQANREEKKQQKKAADLHATDVRQDDGFRKRLRRLFKEIDKDGSGEIDMIELRAGVAKLELGLTEMQLGHFFKAIDVDGSGNIDFDEFETLMVNIMSGKMAVDAGGFQTKIKESLEGRLRRPPPNRPKIAAKTRLNPVGLVQADGSRMEQLASEYGRNVFLNNLTRKDSPVSRTTLRFTCSNLSDFMSRAYGNSQPPEFPCRPVAVINFQDPRTGAWFEGAQSDWAADIVQPFELTVDQRYFAELPRFEVVLYDIEDGQGTAKILVGHSFQPDEKYFDLPVSKRKNILRGTLKVQVREAKGLPRSDVIGLSDPYATVTIGKQTFKTEIMPVTLTPIWEQEFVFEVNVKLDGEDEMRIEVCDFDKVDKDDFLGTFTMRLKDLCSMEDPEEGTEKWFHLRKHDGQFVWGQRVVEQNRSGKAKSKQGGFFTRLQKFTTVDTRNDFCRQELSLGSLIVTSQTLSEVSSRERSIAVREKAQTTTLAKWTKGLDKAMVFNAWKARVRREKNMVYMKQGNSDVKYGGLYITATENTEGGEERVRINLNFKRLMKMDFFGKSDPFFIISQETDVDEFQQVYRSKTIMKNLNPEFPQFEMTCGEFCDNKKERRILIEIFDWDRVGQNDSMGYVMTTLAEMEHFSRSQTRYDIQDQSGKNRMLGQMVPASVKIWRDPFLNHTTYTLDLEVMSWEKGDKVTGISRMAEERALREMDRNANMNQQLHAVSDFHHATGPGTGHVAPIKLAQRRGSDAGNARRNSIGKEAPAGGEHAPLLVGPERTGEEVMGRPRRGSLINASLDQGEGGAGVG